MKSKDESQMALKSLIKDLVYYAKQAKNEIAKSFCLNFPKVLPTKKLIILRRVQVSQAKC